MSAIVRVEEQTGDLTITYPAALSLYSVDVHSAAASLYPLVANPSGAPVYSYERWVRLRFDPSFTEVWSFRFWVPDLVLPLGWTLRYGTTQFFQQPSNANSVIAVNDIPTEDPGPNAPNIGGVTHLDGGATRYSQWVVLQASANGDADVGPVLGFSGPFPNPVETTYDWLED